MVIYPFVHGHFDAFYHASYRASWCDNRLAACVLSMFLEPSTLEDPGADLSVVAPCDYFDCMFRELCCLLIRCYRYTYHATGRHSNTRLHRQITISESGEDAGVLEVIFLQPT
jgi:hypothetical protein